MKTIKVGLVALGLLIATSSFGQDSTKVSKLPVIYTFFVNIVPNGFNLPLIGFINIANGNQKSAHVGFVNLNIINFEGAQIGYINTVGGGASGAQMGFVNTCAKAFSGGQIGFVNTVRNEAVGAQIGFLNTTGKDMNGPQVGFINTAGHNMVGAQIGYVNTTVGTADGGQIGFVNAASSKIDGTQVGFVNAAKVLKGFQLGFINYADTLESGVPFGFLSIIRRGGYKAVELYAAEMYPVNLSVKFGVKSIYTFFSASLNPNADDSYAIGFGMGSIIPIYKSWYFNPEISSQGTISSEYSQHHAFSAKFGYSLNKHFYLSAGPSVVWSYMEQHHPLSKPFFSVYNRSIDSNNRLIVGLRFAAGFNF